MKLERYIVYLWIVLACAACRREEPMQQVGLPVSICLPANEVQEAQRMPARRAMGDPGKTEKFLFPHHLYFLVVKQNDDETWSVWEAEERTLTDADWKPTRYSGSLPTAGDSIYRYTEQINLLLSSGDKFKGHVYAMASSKKLTFNRAFSKAGITNMNDVLSLAFETSPDSIQTTLQHIYTTPYNLEVGGSYYGSFDTKAQRVPTVNLLLYHVAAKVDIKWNVVDSMRINKTDPSKAVRLTYMEAKNLYNGDAYCFQPMRNTVTSMPTTGYAIDSIVVPANEGQWWEGRAYFYTIPYTVTGDPNYFPLQMTLRTNGSTGTGYQPTLNLEIDTSAVFVPWLRANFNLTKPLEDKTETKTVDN